MSNVPAYPKTPAIIPSSKEGAPRTEPLKSVPQQAEEVQESFRGEAPQPPLIVTVREFVHRRPVEAVALAGVVGLFAGLLVRR